MLAAATLEMVATSSRRAKRPEGIWVWTFDLESENHAWNAGRPCPHRHSGETRNLTGTPCQRRGSGLRRNDEGAAILPMLAREGRGGAEQADRKSVVWGKSVAVRGALGGRRHLKTKKKQQ